MIINIILYQFLECFSVYDTFMHGNETSIFITIIVFSSQKNTAVSTAILCLSDFSNCAFLLTSQQEKFHDTCLSQAFHCALLLVFRLSCYLRNVHVIIKVMQKTVTQIFFQILHKENPSAWWAHIQPGCVVISRSLLKFQDGGMQQHHILAKWHLC